MKMLWMGTIASAALLSGCAVGPNYHRPAVQIPAAFRAPEPLPPQQANGVVQFYKALGGGWQ